MKNHKGWAIQAKEWFEKASHDLDTAKREFENAGWSDIICFHCHQAVEKYLKGFLIFYGKDIEEIKIHDLVNLLKYCRDIDRSMRQFNDKCQKLNRYYIETCYPTGAPKEYSKEEIQEAIDAAEEIIKFIFKKNRLEARKRESNLKLRAQAFNQLKKRIQASLQ